MVLTQSQPLGITLPITTEFAQIAQRFAQQCPFDDKAEQIRQNTLAVCAVNAYFQLMDIPTALGESDSWNAMMQMMANVADIKVPGVGTFSCRAAQAQETVCYIPPEDWHNRAGYIAVEIDSSGQQATLLGFMADAPTQEQVPLARFDSIEALLDQVHALQTASLQIQDTDDVTDGVMARVTDGVSDRIQSAMTQLGDWVEGSIATGWQAVEALINPATMNFAFRGVSTPASVNDISRAKLVDLGIQLAGTQPGQPIQVALVMHLTHTSAQRTNIILQVRPLGESPYLIEGLKLTVLDESDNVFMSATSRAIDNYIQLQLSGQPGERFSVQIALDDSQDDSQSNQTFKEQFVI